MKYENNATKNNVKAYETETIFNADGEVIFSAGATLESAMSMRKLDEKGAELGNAAKMVVTLNGERSSWYVWDGEMFVMQA